MRSLENADEGSQVLDVVVVKQEEQEEQEEQEWAGQCELPS